MRSFQTIICFLVFLFVHSAELRSQNVQPKVSELTIQSIDVPPKIDGILDDEVWKDQPIANNFIQTQPKPRKSVSSPCEVKMVYDNEAIYIAARMFEDPDSINNFLTERDNFGNADWFIVVFNNYLDGINGDGFAVTPAGVQIDIKYSLDDESSTWDAVWESATSIDEKGWIAELRIPYSALRFPEADIQKWGVNFGREIRRKRERSWWNFVDPAVDGLLTQTGIINGIKNISPPVRLSFFPYTSAYVKHNSADGSTTSSFNGGMDVKYGLTDAFTLDMTLIPDFGQARFDNQVLNLSQFEIEFNENRQFFTEGLELFNKAGIFYSRRVGGRPFNGGRVASNLEDDEELIERPAQSQLLNATKISGRNKKGLGVGVFNAVEGREFAKIRNTETGESRSVEINPLTNYSVIVLDQVLRKNSFLTLTNTNVTRDAEAKDANVSQLDWQIANKNNEYAFSGNAGMSNIFSENGTETGHNWSATFAKISGNFTFRLAHEQISDTYNPNDLGFLNINNIKRYFSALRYAKYEPFSIFNFARHDLEIIYERLYQPDEFVNFALSWSTVYSLKQFHAIGLNAGIEPVKTNDFFETRVFDQYYKFPTNFWFGGFFSGDYSRPFALDVNMQRRVFNEPGRSNFFYEISPRFRPNDKLFFVLTYNWFQRRNEMGYVANINDSINFGRREVTEYETSVTGNYTFNNKMALNLTLRQYWSTALYNRFNRVDPENGDLLMTDYGVFNGDGTTGSDLSFNAFNIDLAYNWRFAPGSEISVVWKNIILEQGDPLDISYYENIEQVLSAPQLNNFSIKILYFIDYLDIKKKKLFRK